jgi:hypothetical protein
VKPYIDLVLAPPSRVDVNVRAGGLATIVYLDPNFCSGSYPVGPNPYASPDCANFPGDAFYQDPSGNVLTVSYNGRIQQRVGNPSAPMLQSSVLAYLRALLAGNAFDLVEIDDATIPTSNYPGTMCWGVGTFSGGTYSCAGAPGGPAMPSSFLAPNVLASWQSGEAALGASFPHGVIYSGLQGGNLAGHGEPAPIASVVTGLPNAWGAMCDSCFYTTTNPFTVTGPVLNGRLGGIMQVVGAGKNVVVVNGAVTDPVARVRGLAETMLVYSVEHVWEGNAWENEPCGTQSFIHVCPEAALTFYDAYKPYPTSPASLADPGGTYSREFAACYDGGALIGPCAAIVNPDVYHAHPLPALQNVYAHTLTLSGTSLCQCFGDSGSASLTGPAPPATLPPATGIVLFR